MTNPIKCELHIGSDVYELDEVTLRRDCVEVPDCGDPGYIRRFPVETLRVQAVVGKKVKSDTVAPLSEYDRACMDGFQNNIA
ncbi:hypothetical protein Q0601_00845 [Paracoccus onubensis]|uniref:hypothetical protein n=1 Tax=Paracoccus onubensis TaxID=1675788 RepID=UPI00272F35ED|nr:hypothetical protein [Paracoccus onubensis]MDP0925709.1 hypothetical protein [Paracoccus onubensis]